MKSIIALLALVVTPIAFAHALPEPDAHCEGPAQGGYQILFVKSNPTFQGGFEGQLIYRDSGKKTDSFNCTQNDPQKLGDTVFACTKTTAEPGTLRIKIIVTPHGDWAELYTGPTPDQLKMTGTLDCRF